MDQSIIVGLITGSASVPQEDLSLDSKVAIILHTQQLLARNMDALVTGNFRPFTEFITFKQESNKIAYTCEIPTLLNGCRVGIMYEAVTTVDSRAIRHRMLLTTKAELYWWSEEFEGEFKPRGMNIVKDTEIIRIDRLLLRDYLEMYRDLFLRLLGNFKSVAETAFCARERRQEVTEDVLRELNRINRMIGLVRFVGS